MPDFTQSSSEIQVPSPVPCELIRPMHYGGADDPFEAIKVIEAWNLNFSLGNVLKYIRRRHDKDGEAANISKAIWYLNRHLDSILAKNPKA